jgi:predicted metal-dependent enzyme (double-stranded beta helix superfamily)
LNPVHPALAPLARAAKAMPSGEIRREFLRAIRQTAWLRPEHRVGDPTRYMRHVLYVDPDGDFVMTAITWLPGQVSPLHGHRVWCAFGVAEGELTEEQFSLDLVKTKTSLYRAGELAEQDRDGSTVHRVSNRSTQTLVSLHLYGVSADKLTTGINRLY